MTGFVVVVARELRQKRAVVVAAVVAGFVALGVPMFSALGRHDVREARELAALVFAAAFACGVAVVGGGGMITRELIERRHGFLFARPLSAGAIWTGRVVAAWLLAVGCGFAVLLPVAVGSRGVHLVGAVFPFSDAAQTFAVAAAGLLVLVAFAHALSVMMRSRVPWLLALDATLAVAVVTTVTLALRSLVVGYALDAFTRGATAITVAVLVAPLAAGYAQVSVGRTDIRRGHRALSATLWGILGATALLLAGYARWVQAVDLKDLTKLDWVLCAPKGEWAFVSGQARGRGDYRPSFLVDTASGRAVKIAAAGIWWLDPAFSADGTRAVWLSPAARIADPTWDVVTLDLARPESRPVTTPITIPQHGAHVVGLSPDGRWVVVHDGATVSVSDLLSGKLLASARVPEPLESVKVLWPMSDRLYLAGWRAAPPHSNEAEMRLLELDVSRRTLTETGVVADVERLGFFSIAFDPKTGHMLTRTGARSNGSLLLCDARTGARIATLAACADFNGCSATVLSDGTIAVGEAAASGVRLRLFSAAGELRGEVQLGPGRGVRLGGQTTSTTLVVSTRVTDAAPPGSSNRTTMVVDLRTGTVTPLGRGYFPLALTWWMGTVTAPTPGSVATRAFFDPSGSFAILDPATNAFRSVLPARWHTD